MNSAEPYRLTEAENRRVFAEHIAPDLLTGQEPQRQPTTVVLLGQQGAGKTRISAVIAEQLSGRGGYVDLDSDLYKSYHPAYAELMRLDDQEMARHIGPDARQWTHQARALAQANRVNILAHDTAGDPEFSAGLLREYRAEGPRRIEVVALGVPRALSDQGVLNRYYEQVQDRGQGRLSVPEKVEAAYSGMMTYADIVDRDRLADSVTVYRRGESKPRYANVLTETGEYAHPPHFRTALREARNTPLTARDTLQFLRIQDKLREGLPAFRDQLAVIDQQVAPLLDREAVDQYSMMRLAARGFPQSASQATSMQQPEQPQPGHRLAPQEPRRQPEQER
ncbi:MULTISPECIES: zeta toxin family protein [unclassified Streptomyces]|uniref:zeta toxin family protein n=1 Tax=unclassified Streptomyces TaxID=2593676 RepID=UPI0033E5C852